MRNGTLYDDLFYFTSFHFLNRVLYNLPFTPDILPPASEVWDYRNPPSCTAPAIFMILQKYCKCPSTYTTVEKRI